jgi:hypothetical protein
MTYGKLEFACWKPSSKEDTVKLAEGLKAFPFFTADNASAIVLEKLYLCGVVILPLRSMGDMTMSVKKAKL